MLDRGENAKRVVTIAVEGKHRVNQMLNRSRTGQITFLGDVTHEYHWHCAGLGQPGQALHTTSHLRQAPAWLRQLRIRNGLDGVDHGERRTTVLDRRFDRCDIEPLDRSEGRWDRAQPLGAAHDLAK